MTYGKKQFIQKKQKQKKEVKFYYFWRLDKIHS
jgi:hypothetical protein